MLHTLPTCSMIFKTFDEINATLTDNRNEIKEMIYKTQVENEES